MQELLRRLAEKVVNAVMGAEADQLCGSGANSRNDYRERSPVTCVGTLTLRIPKLRSDSFFPEDVIERYHHVDRAPIAAMAEMHATATSSSTDTPACPSTGCTQSVRTTSSATPLKSRCA